MRTVAKSTDSTTSGGWRENPLRKPCFRAPPRGTQVQLREICREAQAAWSMQHGYAPKQAFRSKAHVPRRHVCERCLLCGASSALGTPESVLASRPLSFFPRLSPTMDNWLFLAPDLFSFVLHNQNLPRCLRRPRPALCRGGFRQAGNLGGSAGCIPGGKYRSFFPLNPDLSFHDIRKRFLYYPTNTHPIPPHR